MSITVQEAIDSLSLISNKSLPLELGLTDLENLPFAGWVIDGTSDEKTVLLILTGVAEEYLTGTRSRSTMDVRLGIGIVRPECGRCHSTESKLALVNIDDGPALCGRCANEQESL